MHYSYQGDLVMTTIVIVKVMILVYSSYGYYSHSYEFSILKELLCSNLVSWMSYTFVQIKCTEWMTFGWFWVIFLINNMQYKIAVYKLQGSINSFICTMLKLIKHKVLPTW